MVLGFDGGAGGGGRGLLFFEGEALDCLKFGAGGLELAPEFLLGVFLGGLVEAALSGSARQLFDGYILHSSLPMSSTS